MLNSDYLNCVDSSGLPSHNIILKRHTVIVFMCNLDVTGGNCNSTRHIVLKVTSNYIIAQKLNRIDYNIILIPKIPYKRNETDLGFIFTRLQFPVMLAYYTTFNLFYI